MDRIYELRFLVGEPMCTLKQRETEGIPSGAACCNNL